MNRGTQNKKKHEKVAKVGVRYPQLSDRKDTNVRKLAFLKRSGLFGSDTKGAVIERACKLEDLKEAYRLVHDVYLGTGFVRPEPSGLRLRLFETTSETATFVAKESGRVVGVLSVVGDSADFGLPSDVAFKSELDALRATGARLCEVTNQAVCEEFRRSAVPTELMRCAIAHQIQAGYQFAAASVSPGHQGFYDLLGFKAIGSQRSYSEKLHDPVIALCLDIDRYRRPADDLPPTEKFIHALATASNPFFTQVSTWAREAMSHFLNPELLKQLFVSERNFLAECTHEELRILQRRWGVELFTAVKSLSYLPFTGADSTGAFSPLKSLEAIFGSNRTTDEPERAESLIQSTAGLQRALRRPASVLQRRRLKLRRRAGFELNRV